MLISVCVQLGSRKSPSLESQRCYAEDFVFSCEFNQLHFEEKKKKVIKMDI